VQGGFVPIQFDLDPHVEDAVRRTEELIRDIVPPIEREHGGNAHDLADSVRRGLRTVAAVRR
jgi:acyl-CoA dehydrogenase